MHLFLLATAVFFLTSISFGCVLCLFPSSYHSSFSFTYRCNSTVLDISVVLFPISYQMNKLCKRWRISLAQKESLLSITKTGEVPRVWIRNCYFNHLSFPHCSDNRSNSIKKMYFPRVAIKAFDITERMQWCLEKWSHGGFLFENIQCWLCHGNYLF